MIVQKHTMSTSEQKEYIATSLPFLKWEQISKDPMTTAAAIDRLVHHSVILELNVGSDQLESAKRQMGDA